MDSSSDGSFIWTDASSDTSDSGTMAKKKLNSTHSGEESESGKTYKKKLQQRLFSNSSDPNQPEEKLPTSKRKASSKQSDDEDTPVPKRKSIKTEPESDIDSKKNKKKTKLLKTNDQGQGNLTYDETHLNKTLENEMACNKTRKKIKSLKTNENDSFDENHLNKIVESETVSNRSKNKVKSSKTNGHDSDSESKINKTVKSDIILSDSDRTNKMVKVLKTNDHNLDKDSYDESHLNQKVKHEEHFAVPSPVKIKRTKNKNSSETASLNNGRVENHESPPDSERITTDDENYGTDTETDITIEKTKKKKKKCHREKKHSKEDMEREGSVSRDEVVAQSTSVDLAHTSPEHGTSANLIEKTPRRAIGRDIEESQRESCHTSNKNSTNKSKISERITFEDEEYSNLHTERSTYFEKKENELSGRVKRFIESGDVRVLSAPSGAAALNGDDDLWLLRCPGDVHVEHFYGKKWTIDTKCKIKLDGQTYECDLDERSATVAVTSAARDGTVIRHMPLKGRIRLRRRIPKPLVRDDNVMVNNRANFIPLPDTKCRHPLFGIDYKRSIRLPAAVAERLRPSPDPPLLPDRKKKRKHAAAPKPEPVDEAPRHDPAIKKKKNKRKHSESAEEEVSRRKRPKHDLASAEAWDSEIAIEENLFNFF